MGAGVMDKFTYKNYTNARDASWQLIVDMGIDSLPVDVFKLAKDLGIKIIPYSKSNLAMFLIGLGMTRRKNDAMYVSLLGKKYIFYDDNVASKGRIRFTIAHEIGHHVMRHINTGFAFIPRCVERRKGFTGSVIEREANVFASRLLAPSVVLHYLGITKEEDIAKVCGMSNEAAMYRAERLKKLDQRNCYNMKEIERKVLKNFEGFINENK